MGGRLGSDAPPEWPKAPAQTANDIRAVFDGASELTVGIEEELTLVDPQTLSRLRPSTACSSWPAATVSCVRGARSAGR